VLAEVGDEPRLILGVHEGAALLPDGGGTNRRGRSI
jgi:hypothetical protein